MSTVHDYSTNELGLRDFVTVFNPHPYPITITSLGHTLGGRETAVVLRIDPYVVKALKIGDAILVPEVKAEPSGTTTKRSKRTTEAEVQDPAPEVVVEESGETPSEP